MTPDDDRRRQLGPGDGLTALRGLFLAFLGAFVLIGVVVAIQAATDDRAPGRVTPLVVVVVAVVGVVSLVASRVVGQPLLGETEPELAEAFRRRFFLRVALAESAALAGFARFMVSDAGWVYAVGAAFSLVGFAWLAPSARHLAREEEDLCRRGCTLSVTSALRHALPGAGGRGGSGRAPA
ncbi:MAG: hypothetical protein ACRD12_06645 [Acidimicrobiales bacterium]